MKKLGLIGGMSYESSLLYYKYINDLVKKELGGLNSAKLVLDSLNMAEIAKMQHDGKWQELDQMLIDSAKKLEEAGADCILILTNLMHICAPVIEDAVKIPLLHIADAAALSIKEKDLNKVCLLGSEFTMNKDFYKTRLEDKHKIDCIVPEGTDNKEISRIIYEELCKGEVKDSSRDFYLSVIKKLQKQGAQGVILGCTEIPMLISQEDCELPVFDTTFLHSKMAANFILN